jgi:putative DNA methylase
MTQRAQAMIERWLPLEELSAEQTREKSMGKNTFPPTVRLHVWWARRPLLVSRAAILASVLPAWSTDWPASLKKKFPTEESYRSWFLKLCGIFGDPVASRRLIAMARSKEVFFPGGSPYTHKRAFTVNPSPEVLDTFGDLLEHTWGSRRLSLLDPFAGGGSIPFEAMRYGFDTCAVELNPVATIILRATLEYPAKFGQILGDHVRHYGKILAKKVERRLEPFFPTRPGEVVRDYVWARTVRCPYTGKLLPLTPNWWLRKSSDPVCVHAVFDPQEDEARFEIERGKAECERVKPDNGTVRRGDAISPWAHNQPVDGDYIKAEAKAGRMGQQLYAVVVDTEAENRTFRAPTDDDRAGVRAAEGELTRRRPDWEARGLIPTESRYIGPSDRLENYGVLTFDRMFLPRSLLSMVTALDVFTEVVDHLKRELPGDLAAAVQTYLALAIDKAADYSSIQCVWDVTRLKVAHTFNLHDFRPRWNPGEFDASRFLLQWAIDQVTDALAGITALAEPAQALLPGVRHPRNHQLATYCRSTADLSNLAAQSISIVCMDPPYYDNVIYSECSDFFYVWLKRTIGEIYPELFLTELTNKDDEAVANWARFNGFARKKKDMARADYERKMSAAFREVQRVLRDDGVLTVMFTHKKVEAWDTLATSLIGAGFAIHSSWPVHTESEHSLHQAKKNAAQSTILLTCRKRLEAKEPVWWDDIKGRVRRVAREKAEEFERQGIRGVDLYIATFGPTLAILSENWPVLTSEVDERTGKPKPLRPEVALDLAREEVVALRKRGLLLGRAVQFDKPTDWYLMAWDAFRAEEFPADEARKLALALDLDIEKDVVGAKRLVAKKGSTVVLQQPRARRKKGMVDADRKSFDCWVDAAHTAMLLYQEDGAKACEAFLKQAGLRKDATFKACLQAMMNAIPRTKEKGKFVRPEAEVLEAMRLAFFDDIVPPLEEEIKIEELQHAFTGAGFEAATDDEEDEVEEDEEVEV